MASYFSLMDTARFPVCDEPHVPGLYQFLTGGPKPMSVHQVLKLCFTVMTTSHFPKYLPLPTLICSRATCSGILSLPQNKTKQKNPSIHTCTQGMARLQLTSAKYVKFSHPLVSGTSVDTKKNPRGYSIPS